MSLAVRGVAGTLPPDEVPSLIQSWQTGVYLGLVLGTLLVYDFRE